MSKHTYRGINYEVHSSGTGRTRWSGWVNLGRPARPRDPQFASLLGLGDTELEQICGPSKRDLIATINRLIDIHLDYDGDTELYHCVGDIARNVLRYAGRRTDVTRILDILDQLLPRIRERIQAEFRPDHRELLAKLRRMTEANGCTPAEAAAAKSKLQEILASKDER